MRVAVRFRVEGLGCLEIKKGGGLRLARISKKLRYELRELRDFAYRQ